MARICLHAYVGGRVQGVGFRQATREEADRLELDGWVRNLDDGRVEVVWEGEEDRAKALERWLGRGVEFAVRASRQGPRPGDRHPGAGHA